MSYSDAEFLDASLAAVALLRACAEGRDADAAKLTEHATARELRPLAGLLAGIAAEASARLNVMASLVSDPAARDLVLNAPLAELAADCSAVADVAAGLARLQAGFVAAAGG